MKIVKFPEIGTHNTMGKHITEDKIPGTTEKCPLCGSELRFYFGEMYDWDLIACSNHKCYFEKQLKTITCHEPDGRIYQIKEAEEYADKTL